MTSTQNRPALNGVDVPMLFATLDTVEGGPILRAGHGVSPLVVGVSMTTPGTLGSRPSPDLPRTKAG